MSKPSSNVVPIEAAGQKQPLDTLPLSELNALSKDILSPSIFTLSEALLRFLELHVEAQDNNQDIMRWAELKNCLKQRGEALQTNFLNELTRDDNDQPATESPNFAFELLDNDELEHRLLWQRSTRYFEKADNAEKISRINRTLDALYPHYDGAFPATTERICVSFSKALITLEPEPDIEAALFQWCASHLQKPVDELINAIDQIITARGLEVKSPTRPQNPPEQKTNNNTLASQTSPSDTNTQHSDSASEHFHGIDHSTFLTALTDKVASRIEDRLVEDEIISAATGIRVNTVDLTRVLTNLQTEVTLQNSAIGNLHESVTLALAHQGIESKLYRHHDDLINMIGWLFEFIINDHQLPEELKKTIALLQIPVLKEAIQDDSFLTNQEHPARGFLNAITSAGLEYGNDEDRGHSVLLLIDDSARYIISNHNEQPSIFADMLAKFDHNLSLILTDDTRNKEEPFITDDTEQEESPEEIFTDTDISLSWDELFDQEPQTDTQEEPAMEELVGEEPISEAIMDSFMQEQDDAEEEIVLSKDTADGDSEDDDLYFGAMDGQMPTPEKSDAPIIIEGLHPGQWIEFVGKGNSHRFRCKLAKLSKDKHRYIFENSSGLRVAEIAGSDLKKEIENGSIVIEQDNQVFDRAIQAVMNRFKKH